MSFSLSRLSLSHSSCIHSGLFLFRFSLPSTTSSSRSHLPQYFYTIDKTIVYFSPFFSLLILFSKAFRFQHNEHGSLTCKREKQQELRSLNEQLELRAQLQRELSGRRFDPSPVALSHYSSVLSVMELCLRNSMFTDFIVALVIRPDRNICSNTSG